jgi:hypothetical protein
MWFGHDTPNQPHRKSSLSNFSAWFVLMAVVALNNGQERIEEVWHVMLSTVSDARL